MRAFGNDLTSQKTLLSLFLKSLTFIDLHYSNLLFDATSVISLILNSISTFPEYFFIIIFLAGSLAMSMLILSKYILAARVSSLGALLFRIPTLTMYRSQPEITNFLINNYPIVNMTCVLFTHISYILSPSSSMEIYFLHGAVFFSRTMSVAYFSKRFRTLNPKKRVPLRPSVRPSVITLGPKSEVLRQL